MLSTHASARGVLAAVAAAFILVPAPAMSAPALAVTPQDAIARAVAQRFGGRVAVEVTTLETSVGPEAGLEAIPDPAGRTGRPVRYVLMAHGVRRGAASASVRVLARFARAARAIDRGESLPESALDIVEGELPSAAFRSLPAPDDLVGLRARRAIAPGELLGPAVLAVPPLVRSGDRLTISMVIGSVHATSAGVASGSGQRGDAIRVLQIGTRRPLTVRITGRGTVEVMQ